LGKGVSTEQNQPAGFCFTSPLPVSLWLEEDAPPAMA
jgi:hypothetical protein